MSSAAEKFDQLVALMARLRARDGCPWDREQTFDTIKPYTLEETYEVLDAIERRDWPHLAEELGDFLLQAVFYAQMAQEAGYFSIADALDAINAKLIRRHPHVFGTGTAGTSAEVLQRWDEIKAQEKAEKGTAPQLLLDNVPRSLPALMEAMEIARKVAKVGFDWDHIGQVVDKLHEELNELHDARANATQDEIEDELGDLLFVTVNLARFCKVDAEQALRRANRKFRDRFNYVEQKLAEQGRTPAGATLNEMEDLWQQAKRNP